jgi:(1->4)-alpha-D-glucan 1-alpha-D-glucosylmutase
LTRTYVELTSDQRAFHEHEYECKRHVVRYVLISELNVLAQATHRIAMSNRHFRDFTLLGLTHALTEIVCAFPVYRTYVRAGKSVGPRSERVVRAAVRLARLRNRALNASVFAFFEDLLLLRLEGSEADKQRHAAFALRFQQLTGPIMAKAVEDTAFYRYSRLICRNEVGDSPGKLSTSLREFHRDGAERARSWPLAMVTTATHDTKRGDDAGVRIAALSEQPEEWARAVRRWRELSASARGEVEERPVPEPTLEYAFYQTLVGAWPFGAGEASAEPLRERLPGYLLKAAREAKTETSWLSNNADYESKLLQFCSKVMKDRDFIRDVARFCSGLDQAAATNALAQTLLRLCVPGIPDTYQGAELWNQSLVDPDNRRPVDFELRRRYLAEIRSKLGQPAALASELLETYPDGRVKLYVTHLALELRRREPELFAQGDYVPLDGGEQTVAFMRTYEDKRVACVVPRLSRRLLGNKTGFPTGAVWGDRDLLGLDPGRYRNLFTGEVLEVSQALRLARALAVFPLALLVREST